MTPPRITDEAVLETARDYVRHCLEIMRQELTPEKFDEVVQHVARFDQRMRKP